MASQCVEPDARCYRFAAEACIGTGDDDKPSPEAERLLMIARGLESSKGSVDLDLEEQEDGSSVGSGALGLPNAATLSALLETSVGEDLPGSG